MAKFADGREGYGDMEDICALSSNGLQADRIKP
jgi:hypothetical protein